MLLQERRGESDPLKMLDDRFSGPSPSKSNRIRQDDSKFNQPAAMPSSSCQLQGLKTRNNAHNLGGQKFGRPNVLTSNTKTPSRIPKPAQSMEKTVKTMNELDNLKTATLDGSGQMELRQWHKLKDDYERLQFVASSRAHNKLIESSSESDGEEASSQASTVFEASTSAIGSQQGEPLNEVEQLSGSVGQCLDELVEAVASRPAEPVPHKVFSLHEAVCAKTNSSATTTSASEDSSSGDETRAKLASRWPALDRVAIEPLGHFELASDQCDRDATLAQAKEVARDARAKMPSASFLAALDETGRSIECTDSNNNKCSVDLDQVVDCLQDDQLIVWLIRYELSQNDQGALGQSDEDDAAEDRGLDLDDIALALNEPVASRPDRSRWSHGGRFVAVVWTCGRGLRDAKRLRDVWLQHRIKSQKQAAVEQSNLIEVKPSEVAVNSATARQIRSSGLFVLQTGRVAGQRKTSAEGADAIGSQLRETVMRNQRSISSLNLVAASSDHHLADSNPGAAQPAQSQQQGGQSNLAYYYRNVASKVLSSSSSRLKNFTLESGQTLARGARRLSMAINQQLPHQQTAASSSRLAEAPKAKPRTSVLKRRDSEGDLGLDGNQKRDPGQQEAVESSSIVCPEQPNQRAQVFLAESRPGPSQSTGNSRHGSSVASRARQRRPALLLTNPPAEWAADMDQNERRPLGNVSISSQTDGTVRAKVGMSHLRRSASMKVLAGESLEHSAGRHPNLVDTQPQASVGREKSRKKSEFDPRSLRKLSCSETARALRDHHAEATTAESGGDSSARQRSKTTTDDERRLARDRARRRKSMANLNELRCELEEGSVRSAAELEPGLADGSSGGGAGGQRFGKNFNLLRQSFKQNNLSRAIMSIATSRQSLRVKKSAPVELRPDEEAGDQEEEGHADGSWTSDTKPAVSASRRQKLEAIELAEANLLAARRLKQQAQRVREQQRRSEQQQQQTSLLDQAAILFYNQQMQIQQQQLIYQAQQQQQQQQQYALSSGYNQQLFDPLALYHNQAQQQPFAHQLQQNRRRQQQLAYLSNHTAHFMAASSAAAAQNHLAFGQTAPPADHLYPAGQMACLGLGSMPALIGQSQAPLPQQQAAFPLDHNQSALIGRQQRSGLAKYQQQQQQQQPEQQVQHSAYLMTANQQFIPMSVNHHSSFNIVYTAAAAAASQHQQMVGASEHQANQFISAPYLSTFLDSTPNSGQQVAMPQQQFLTDMVARTQPTPAPAFARSKHSSLGASVRKTMRSILRNGKSVAGYAVASAGKTRSPSPPSSVAVVQQQQQQQSSGRPLKSALKATSSREQHQLNSEGSDASDASSSTSSDFSPTRGEQAKAKQRSKTSAGQRANSGPSSFCASSPSSSDLSLASSSTPTRRELEELSADSLASSSSISSNSTTRTGDNRQDFKSEPSGPATASVASQRKNVTFSTKLTSIL